MYRVPPDRAWWPAVGARLERGVRHRCVCYRQIRSYCHGPIANYTVRQGDLARRELALLYLFIRRLRSAALVFVLCTDCFRTRLRTPGDHRIPTRSLNLRWCQVRQRSVRELPTVTKRGTPDFGPGFQRRPRIGGESAADGCMVCAVPNVRGEAGPTVGRQARAGENVQRTARPGLVARRWASPRPRG